MARAGRTICRRLGRLGSVGRVLISARKNSVYFCLKSYCGSGFAWRLNGLYVHERYNLTLFHDCSVPGVQVTKLYWVRCHHNGVGARAPV